MSHQLYPSHDALKEPHCVSVKVLRLSRPSLVPQYPSAAPPSSSPSTTPPSWPASLAYQSPEPTSNPDPFLLSPILNLPASFGAAYVGETFSCTLCVNNESIASDAKKIRDVRISADMKTPGPSSAHKLSLDDKTTELLPPGTTVQQIVSFDLKEEGNHVLAVTVSYYEASDTSGRTRTFRKLYQFMCKPSLIVRTKVGVLARRTWVLEAQLENCGDEPMYLDKVVMEMEPGLAYQDCNWRVGSSSTTHSEPVLHPGEVEQVCFVVSERAADDENVEERGLGGRIVFGVLGIGWRGEMGNRGFLSTGKLGTRIGA